MPKSRFLALFVGCALFLGAPAAWPARWRSIGPEGGYIPALAIAPSDSRIAYAGTDGGVFRSSDGGSSWSAMNRGFDNLFVSSLAVDPRDSAVVYAGTADGLYKTTSGGKSWRLLPLALDDVPPSVSLLAIDPVRPGTLYAVTDEGVFRTDDGGSHWTQRDAGLPPDLEIVALELDPDHPGTLFAGVRDSSLDVIPAVYKTTDGGGSWSVLPGLQTSFVFGFARQRSTDTLYASTSDGLFSTQDGGATWALLFAADLVTPISPLVVAPSGALYGGADAGGVVRSDDGGRTWNPVPSSPDLPHGTTVTLAFDAQGNRLLAGTVDRGVFSLEAGTGWKAVNRGLRATDISGLAVSLTKPTLLFASTFGGGVFASGTGGADFSARNTGIPLAGSEVLVSGLAADPSTPRSLMVGLYPSGIAQTSDAGRHWTSESPICSQPDVLALAPPATLFVSSASSGNPCSDSASCKARVSHDGGSSFACIDGPTAVSAFLVDPLRPAVVYAAANDAIWKSTDRGDHFSLVASNLGLSFITALASSPAAHQTLYAGGGSGVLKSTDGGASWFAADAGLPSGVSALVVDPSNPSLVYATLLDGSGVFESHNGGAKWSPPGDGFPATLNMTLLALDPVHHVLYLGTRGRGAWALTLP